MANGMTVDQLYEAFMDMDTDDPTPFAEDVFGFFGKETLGGYTQEEWAKQYGTYLPTWDPAQVILAGRKRDLDYRDAMNLLETTQAATERVYATEMDTLSTTLGKELSKGREIAGGIGLRLGSLESAIQDTIATTGSKAKDFGDRTRIAGQETKDIYNSAMVDSALDFDKTERDEKEEFYDRTMAAIMRLMDTGAFDDPEGPAACTEEQINSMEGGGTITSPCVWNGEVIAAGWYDEEAYYDEDTGEECTCVTDITGSTTCDPPDCNPDWQSSDETFCDPQIDDPNHYLYCEGSDTTPDEVVSDFSLGGCTRQEQDCSWLCKQNPWCDCPADICYSGWPDFSVVSCSEC